MSYSPELIAEVPPPSKTNEAGIKSGNRGGSAPGPVTLWLWALRDHPGVWHRYPDQVNRNTPTRIKSTNDYSDVEPGEFEAVGRNWDGSRCTLYARWVGVDR